MNDPKGWRFRFANFEYRYLLPAMTRLPWLIGSKLARIRGRVNCWLDRDWRRFLGDNEVSGRTLQAYAELAPESSTAERKNWLKTRFCHAAFEEWEGAILGRGRLPQSKPHYYDIDLVSRVAAERPIVFITAHFGSSIFGSVFLARQGWVINPMSSNVIENVGLPKAIGGYYARKYQGLSSHMNGGKVMHRETHLRSFYKALHLKQHVIVLGDLPASPGEDPVWAHFFGKKRGFAPGAFRLAQKNGAALVAYLCTYGEDGQYRVQFSSVLEPDNEDTPDIIYSFFEREISKDPSLWWAADLLPLLPVRTV